jgi:S-adenosylmethionine:tRNA ribosyltransferase-isomerase
MKRWNVRVIRLKSICGQRLPVQHESARLVRIVSVLVSEFDFQLPEELIAQEPLADRAASRMLALDRASGTWQDRMFADLPEFLRPGDLLVLNNTRVIPARLFGRRTGLQTQPGHEAIGRVEVMLTEQFSEWEWRALVRPGRKVPVGEVIHFGDEGLQAEVIGRGEFGERMLRFMPIPDFFSALERTGHIPLPPYIHREDRAEDRERYQTVFNQQPGSVAAPTAGLHFTPQILAKLEEQGVQTAYITLHVGLGTFQPVRVDKVEDIRLHRERYTLSSETAAAVNAALRENRRVIAVGTTTVRTLEHCATLADGYPLTPHAGETEIFISPGDNFRIVQGLLTNFHLPQSTLLMLVSAFAGREPVLAAYRHAVEQRYRFFSYGDCMLLL